MQTSLHVVAERTVVRRSRVAESPPTAGADVDFLMYCMCVLMYYVVYVFSYLCLPNICNVLGKTRTVQLPDRGDLHLSCIARRTTPKTSTDMQQRQQAREECRKARLVW